MCMGSVKQNAGHKRLGVWLDRLGGAVAKRGVRRQRQVFGFGPLGAAALHVSIGNVSLARPKSSCRPRPRRAVKRPLGRTRIVGAARDDVGQCRCEWGLSSV